MKVLLLNQSETMKKYIHTIFTSLEYVVVHAEDFLHFITLNGHFAFDILCLDFELEGMRGLEVCELIRKSEKNRNVPIVLFSSEDNVESKVHRSGLIDVYIIKKPFTVNNIRSSFAGIFDRKEKEFSVLLVEDDRVNQKFIKRFFDKKAIPMKIANNGKEAVDMLSKENFKLVFMDVEMPEMNGRDATRVIRNPTSFVLNHSVPIIALTASEMENDRKKCIDAGMNDFLLKPVDFSRLEALIGEYSGR